MKPGARGVPRAASAAAAAASAAAPAPADPFAADLAAFARKMRSRAKSGRGGGDWYGVEWNFVPASRRMIEFTSTTDSADKVTIRLTGGSAGCVVPKHVWLIAALIDCGLDAIAAILCPDATRLALLKREGMRRPIVYRGRFHIHGELSELSSIDCAAGYDGFIMRTLDRIYGYRTGQFIIDRIETLDEIVHIISKKGILKVKTKKSDADYAILHADAGCLLGQEYHAVVVAADGSATIQDVTSPPAALLAHELIHIISEKEDRLACKARAEDRTRLEWTSPEEELAIKGYIAGGAAPRAYSECHILVELGMPIRFGHSGTTAALTAAEMDTCYGAGWAARYGLERRAAIVQEVHAAVPELPLDLAALVMRLADGGAGD